MSLWKRQASQLSILGGKTSSAPWKIERHSTVSHARKPMQVDVSSPKTLKDGYQKHLGFLGLERLLCDRHCLTDVGRTQVCPPSEGTHGVRQVRGARCSQLQQVGKCCNSARAESQCRPPYQAIWLCLNNLAWHPKRRRRSWDTLAGIRDLTESQRLIRVHGGVARNSKLGSLGATGRRPIRHAPN